ncbi:triosephosphate isomerase [Marinomonas sp. SBI22]|uniref:triose-phosphate isomerase n=1 Tax=unclassified Marinomonas TaxID=196814 RepID=UPI0007AFD105|nr:MULTISPECIES: triose-phosphate isomerase [unclassified Marinomonas]KZM40882.1 triosephosphate isomerase [Marinomonas sp. SBI22]KZM42722.1 triosephosphate isomerase [Marinomonas sp. SBI8L]
MARQKIVAGNWKMNGSSESINQLVVCLNAAIENTPVEVVVAPSFPYLAQVDNLLEKSSIKMASQNVSEQGSGAFTGEVSISMLQDFAVDYVLIGHSERRSIYGETDQVIAEKAKALLATELTPVLCIGESLEQREQNITLDVCFSQIDAVLNLVGVNAFEQVVIAYEPVWAIGTGLSASAEQAQEVHKAIREHIAKSDEVVSEKVRIIYGGSVKSSSSSDLFAMPDIDGALVGGASLKVEEFIGIVKSAG